MPLTCMVMPSVSQGGLIVLSRGCSVQGKIAGYLNKLAQLGVAGMRVDAAKHMSSRDLGSILQVCSTLSS